MKTVLQKTLIPLLLISIIVGLWILVSSLKKYEFAVPADNYISIEELIDQQKLDVKIIGLGGYQENCIEFTLQNITPDSLFLKLEAGRRLVAEDSVYQDIFIVKEKYLILLPLSINKMKGYGFCCQHNDRAPSKGSVFTIGYMAPPAWVKLAQFINKNDFPVNAIQHAIWSISDYIPVSSIYDSDLKKVIDLRKLVAELKGVEFPWYSVTYEKDTALLFSNKPEMVYGQLNYSLRNNSIVSINVRNSYGMVVKTISEGFQMDAGNHTHDLKLNVKNWPKGSYQIFIYEGFSTVVAKSTFKLE